MTKLTGSLSPLQDLTGSLSPLQELTGVLSVMSGSEPAEYYPGPYEVTPAVYEQSLETARLMMRDDVTVHEIPYAETSNIYGTTVSIAS